MNRSAAVALADSIAAVRPEWNQAGILSQLEILARNWEGTDAGLSAHAHAVAANPDAHTPAAFNATPPTRRRTEPTWSREPRCHICGRNRSRCLNLRETEIRRGIPDPHDFESAEDAEQRAANRQLNA